VLSAATIRLGDEAGWVLLHWEPGQPPEAGLYLSHLLGPLGVNPLVVAGQLSRQTNDGARRALVLALGEFKESQLAINQKHKITDLLKRLFVSDSDPGIHSGCEWVLRNWGHRRADLIAMAKAPGQRLGKSLGWALAPEGHTMALILEPFPAMIGAPLDEPNRRPDEQWLQYLPRPFAIATAETTNAQYRSFATPYKVTGDDDCPITTVYYSDAMRYCNWLSAKAGLPPDEYCYEVLKEGSTGVRPFADYLNRRGYRLPTEQEWEYACRAGTTTPRFFGSADDLCGSYAWNRDNTDKIRSVALLRPNSFGLFDILGNAFEWCSNAEVPPAQSVQVYRGGTYTVKGLELRAAYRIRTISSSREERVGFRIAQSLRHGI
jgi:formylglycine-generating enzyme required for sulfatase activity